MPMSMKISVRIRLLDALMTRDRGIVGRLIEMRVEQEESHMPRLDEGGCNVANQVSRFTHALCWRRI